MNFFGKRILIIAAHPDDEVLGCGGLISKFYRDSKFKIIFLAEGVSVRFESAKKEELQSAISLRNSGAQYLDNFGINDSVFHNLACGTLPLLDPKLLHNLIKQGVEDFEPDYIFTHSRLDNHQDHRAVYDAAMVAVRPIQNLRKIGLISFEVLSSSEWNFDQPFTPNLFIDLSILDLENKIRMMEAYTGELREYPFPRSKVGIETLAKYRGIQSGFEFAEAFKAIRIPIA